MPATADCPGNGAVPRFDALDQPLLGLRAFDGTKEHAIAGNHGIALVRAERFEDPPRGALIGSAVVAQHRARQSENREHAAAAAGRQIDVQKHVKRNFGVA